MSDGVEESKGSPGNDGPSQALVKLHSLVVLNASDHFTRSKSSGPRVSGVLFGFENPGEVDVTTSFEFSFVAGADGKVAVSEEHFSKAYELFSSVFEGLKLVGWYSAADEVTEEHLAIHQIVAGFAADPVFVQVGTSVEVGAKNLPLCAHRAVTRPGPDGTPGLSFVPVPFRVESSDAERILADHVAKLAPTGAEGEPGLNNQLQSLHGAVSALKQRVDVIRTYLLAVKARKVPVDPDLMRRISGLCAQLPVMDARLLQDELDHDRVDGLLVTALATLTENVELSHELSSMTSVLGHKLRGHRDEWAY